MNRGMDLETILKIAVPLILFVVVPILNEIAKVVRKIRKAQGEYRRTGQLPSQAGPTAREDEPMPMAVPVDRETIDAAQEEPPPTVYDERMQRRRRELEARRAMRQGRRPAVPSIDAAGGAQMDAMREALAAIGIDIPVPAQTVPRATVTRPAPRPAAAPRLAEPQQPPAESHASASSLDRISAPTSVSRTRQAVPLASVLDRTDWTPLQRAFVLADVFGRPVGA